jgi:hypothetical protein
MSDPNTTAHPCLWCKLLTNACMTHFNIPTSKFVIQVKTTCVGKEGGVGFL